MDFGGRHSESARYTGGRLSRNKHTRPSTLGQASPKDFDGIKARNRTATPFRLGNLNRFWQNCQAKLAVPNRALRIG